MQQIGILYNTLPFFYNTDILHNPLSTWEVKMADKFYSWVPNPYQSKSVKYHNNTAVVHW